MSPLRQRYIDAGFIKPCPYRNRKPLTLQGLIDHGYWAAAKAKLKAANDA
jgi:hypothetical protein